MFQGSSAGTCYSIKQTYDIIKSDSLEVLFTGSCSVTRATADVALKVTRHLIGVDTFIRISFHDLWVVGLAVFSSLCVGAGVVGEVGYRRKVLGRCVAGAAQEDIVAALTFTLVCFCCWVADCNRQTLASLRCKNSLQKVLHDWTCTYHVVGACTWRWALVLTVCVEVVATVWPRQLTAERRKHEVERPSDDHVVKYAGNDANQQHTQTQTWNQQRSQTWHQQ